MVCRFVRLLVKFYIRYVYLERKLLKGKLDVVAII
ncbi:hypothetical protein TAMC210_21960 [Thermanaeromonas sp. C210]|nr:hypothetical protein TAMC210_21960 [Thermanaeromonas sp. C210]